MACVTRLPFRNLVTTLAPHRLSVLAGHNSYQQQALSKARIYPQISVSAKHTMAPIPKMMKGVIVEKTGGVEVLDYKADVPVPSPKDGQILVKNEYIGINFIDTYFRTGLYPSQKPEILGREAEGTVIAVGGGHTYGIKEGDRVVWMGTSAYAEYSAVPADKAHVLPSGLEPGQGAALTLQGLTALTLIREAYPVQKGDWILVHAAAGGVGLLLVQLLKAVGAHVIGTASTAEKLALAKDNGAEVLINYKEVGLGEDFTKKIMEVTKGNGVSAVFDGVGASTFESDLAVVARKGTIASFGNASGAVPPFDIRRLSAKNIQLLRPTLFNYIYTREEFESYAKELFDFALRGELRIKVHNVYPLSEIRQVHSDLEGRVTTGKLLVKP